MSSVSSTGSNNSPTSTSNKMNGKAKLRLNGPAPVMKKKTKEETTGVLPPLVSLKCSLCNGYLNEPVTLQCLHSYCRGCLENYNQKFYSDKPALMVPAAPLLALENGNPSAETKLPELEDQKPVVCPHCIENLGLVVPPVATAPFENSRLSRIVGLVESDNIVCQNCDDTTSEMKCNTCNAWLCIPCMELTHAAPIFKSHQTERLSHEEMMALPKCSYHPLNDLEFFSTEEEIGVCQVCLLKGEFVGKPYCLVSDVRKIRQEDIEKDIEFVMENRERLLKGRSEAEAVAESLDANLERQTAAVKQNFESIRKALDQREAETLKALKALKDAKAGVLEKQLSQLKSIVAVIDDGVKNVDLVLNHSNDLELVYMTVVLQDFVSDLSRIDAKRFKGGMLDLPYYYKPAVDDELPVVLSDRVAQLVSVYASVPSADGVEGFPNGLKAQPSPKLTKQQKEILDDVAGAKTNAEEFGCLLQ